MGWNSSGSASYGRIGTFKNVGGTVSQVGGLAALGIAEDDTVYEALLDLASNQIRLRVAGKDGNAWGVFGVRKTTKVVTSVFHWSSIMYRTRPGRIRGGQSGSSFPGSNKPKMAHK